MMIPGDELYFLHIFYSLKQQKKSSDKDFQLAVNHYAHCGKIKGD